MRRCVVCGDPEWLVAVGRSHPDTTNDFCPRCIPEEFSMVRRDLPVNTIDRLRWSWRKLHEPKCPYTKDEKARAERRMYAKAKEFGIKLPEIKPL